MKMSSPEGFNPQQISKKDATILGVDLAKGDSELVVVYTDFDPVSGESVRIPKYVSIVRTK